MFPAPEFKNIIRCREFTRRQLEHVRIDLAELEELGVSVIVNGSYAREEASPASDFDYFLLVPDDLGSAEATKIRAKVKRVVLKHVGKEPSPDGAFSAVEKIGEFAKIVGGQSDTNHLITRRILFLTEGKAVCGQELFEAERGKLVSRMYIRDGITDHQLGLFLLNDIIRYWRTICVDFENKTIQNGKPWGIRNIKLVFSRKLLYFGGVLICAEMAQRTLTQKRDRALQLMKLTPIERLCEICGSAAAPALSDYDYFLELMEQNEVRDQLETVYEDRDTHPEIFRAVKNRGHHFSMHLIDALQAAYGQSHPIHRALIM